MLCKFDQGACQSTPAGKKGTSSQLLVCFTQSYRQDFYQLAVEVGMHGRKGREGCAADKTKFTVLHDHGGRGPRKPVNNGQFTYDRTRPEHGDDAFFAEG